MDFSHQSIIQQSIKCDDLLNCEYETQVSEGGKGDLHKHLANCKKNPGHTKFIPVEKFNFRLLPVSHSDVILCDSIRAGADLAVQITVGMISPHRPDTWPTLNVPYAYAHLRGRKLLRTGSGRVWNVYKFTDGYSVHGVQNKRKCTKCTCGRCQRSPTPSNVWWEIVVDTATHVVFDACEASRTACVLFYDSEDSPVVNLDGVYLNFANVDRDLCQLNCVTCDMELGDKLDRMVKHFNMMWRKVYDKYKKSRDADRLTFIVSHPHGCAKQVSVGQWKDKFSVGKYYKFTYDACTCPGSSGAQVYIVGYNGRRGLYHHPMHCGSIQSLNCSGPGEIEQSGGAEKEKS